MVGLVPVVECQVAAHGQAPVVHLPLARPAAVAPRNCRAAGPALAADPALGAGRRGVDQTSAVGQYREVAGRTSAPDQREALASVAGAGGRFRRCRRPVRTSDGPARVADAQAFRLCRRWVRVPRWVQAPRLVPASEIALASGPARCRDWVTAGKV